MKQLLKFSLLSLLVIILVSGCNTSNGKEDIFKYKDSFVGDNSAVGNIVRQLQGAEHFQDFELKTKDKPYGVILNYDWLNSEQKYKEAAIHNATFIFALVQNVDWITFNFDDQEYKITKENLQDWYGEDLSGLSEDELHSLTQRYLDAEDKINQLFD
ncbi:hypothetical protein J416_09044 [Gracilibacillus halophilus YIM-C55.5]|uniref:DUF4825 domain-containing protein n=1 Tax=Gracilibacillus halophilus YIM-C55.5 TaxID=1308866 RepID=N4WQL0_9BACI|nr:DUF4825 domain-containing protein [Gracilibacillus halophilus]ENH96745.1 hypothetical protein J416_09044 [Gracilibacillus halophilus YIM-C55.5]